MRRRHFIRLSGASMFSAPFIFSGSYASVNKIPLFVDADTANEIDDLYAITRALLEPKLEVRALSSAQWFHHLSPRETAQESQRLNEDILRLLDRQDIPHPKGSEMIVGKPWGGQEPSDSPATQLMIKTARQMKSGERLVIASLGAVTNAASAILLAPDIVPKISLYCLSGKYFSDRKVWDKDEFNARRDLNALNTVFNTEGLDLHVMPVNILYDFKFRFEEVENRLAGKGGIWDYLYTRWRSFAPQNKDWIMWDLALIEAIIHPDWATQEQVNTPPENKQRKINVYTAIKREKMLEDWWNTTENNNKK